MRLIHSLRGELLAWLGLPLLLLWALSVYTHYQSGLAAANQAYDRCWPRRAPWQNGW